MTMPVEWSQVTPQVAAATERRANARSIARDMGAVSF
jgi:hypothetical protein